jgi:MSHA biogenesis protein MshI
MFWGRKKAGSQGWTAVDPGVDALCGVTVQAGGAAGKPRVLKHAAMELGPLALPLLAKKIAVPGCPWTLQLRREDYKIMVVPEPAVQATEMTQSLRWSLAGQLDFPIEEATVDWMHIPTRKHLPQRPQHLYAVVARSEVIKQRTEPYRKVKFPLQAVDIRETAQRNIAALLEKPGEGLGLVSVSEQGVQITFTYEGELYLDRFMEEPLASIVAGDEESRKRVFDRITLQVQRSLDFLTRTLPFVHISRILVAPLPAPIALREHLAEHLAEPIEALDLASAFDFSMTPELREEETQARYFVALGAALRGMAART